MGAWGTGIYDNDDAADWAHGLDDGGLDLIRSTLAAATPGSPVDADRGAEALAAADVIARLKSGGGEQSPYAEPVMSWVDEHDDDQTWTALVPAARAAVVAVRDKSSELHELWAEDASSLSDWLLILDELDARLIDDNR